MGKDPSQGDPGQISAIIIYWLMCKTACQHMSAKLPFRHHIWLLRAFSNLSPLFYPGPKIDAIGPPPSTSHPGAQVTDEQTRHLEELISSPNLHQQQGVRLACQLLPFWPPLWQVSSYVVVEKDHNWLTATVIQAWCQMLPLWSPQTGQAAHYLSCRHAGGKLPSLGQPHCADREGKLPSLHIAHATAQKARGPASFL